MSEVLSMFVYFTNEGDITAISPVKLLDNTIDNFSEFSIESVENFLTGKSKLHEYQVISNKGELNKGFRISKKAITSIDLKRTLDSYLTEINTIVDNISVYIENNIDAKVITIRVNPVLRHMLLDENDDNNVGVRQFFKTESLPLFFTRKHDPYFMLFSTAFSPIKLLKEGEMHINYSVNLSTASLFTTRILDGFSYITKDI